MFLCGIQVTKLVNLLVEAVQNVLIIFSNLLESIIVQVTKIAVVTMEVYLTIGICSNKSKS